MGVGVDLEGRVGETVGKAEETGEWSCSGVGG